MLFAKSKDQSSILRTLMVEGKDSSMILHLPPRMHAYTQTFINV